MLWGSNTETFSHSTGGYYFSFLLKKMSDGKVRLYIKNQPNYGARSSGLHDTHRYDSSDGYYVCIRGDLEPSNFRDAKDWAKYWSKQTANYIRTGQSFS